MSRYPPPRTNPPGYGVSMDGWSPGQRYSYSQWSPHERRGEARARAGERARIAQMTDVQLTAYLGMQAGSIGLSWWARCAYRAAWHEITIVRGAAGVPRI